MAVWSSIEVDQALVTVPKFALGKGKNNSHMNLEDRQNGRERERERASSSQGKDGLGANHVEILKIINYY